MSSSTTVSRSRSSRPTSDRIISAHDILASHDCAQPGCVKEADRGSDLCRMHQLPLMATKPRLTCRIPGCTNKPNSQHPRGYYAGLCAEVHLAEAQAHIRSGGPRPDEDTKPKPTGTLRVALGGAEGTDEGAPSDPAPGTDEQPSAPPSADRDLLDAASLTDTLRHIERRVALTQERIAVLEQQAEHLIVIAENMRALQALTV